MNDLVMRLDDIGKPAWITLMVLSFIVFWPVGLAVLAFLLWSGRMGCWHGEQGRWQQRMAQRWDNRAERWSKMDRWGRAARAYGSSGNRAFDEYREETMRRLEDEQREFREFLERLRAAKDRAEFDHFMTDRKNRPAPPPPDAQPPVPQS
ncbi:MAG: DUF2852 domain-containing protein [Hyphomicrobium sp.]